MPLLSAATLDRVPPTIPAPRGRAPLGTGIVHFGPGAFHRAHQAAFVDSLLDADPRWGIAAVSMRSRATIQALADQDGLYTLAVRDAAPSFRVIGAHTAFLSGDDDAAAIGRLLADPRVALVTATVTEKGYCLDPDGGLDLAHRDVAHDLEADGSVPCSLVGWLAGGLAARRAAGVAPFVVMPCDNLPANGRKLHAALVAFARARGAPGLADWIAAEVRAPSTMVDAITPASDDALYRDVSAAIGLDDHAAVQREAFAQWVIEDVGQIGPDLAGPDLAAGGAIVTRDLAGFERAKLRILNAAHSALAYSGLLAGHESVAQAMADPALAAFVEGLIADEVVPVLDAVPGLDLTDYARTVFARFRNPAIVHRLDQIAQDGSQKLPVRWGPTLIAQRRAGALPARLLTAYGRWIGWWRRSIAADTLPADPRAREIAGAIDGAGAAGAARALAAAGLGLPREVAGDAAALDAIAAAADAACG